MNRKEFKEIQQRLGLRNNTLARLFGVTNRSVVYWRNGGRKISGPVKILMTLLDRHPEHIEELKKWRRENDSERNV